ncbi:MAG: hypothetical protein ACI4HI_16040 [Lachnospiraceae bacterium]
MQRKDFCVSDELMSKRFTAAVDAARRKAELVPHSDVHSDVMRSRKEPMALVYAGPNGSGKSTFQEYMEVRGEYISSDEIMRASLCTDIEAAAKSTELRTKAIHNHADFTFEMVMTTERNLRILRDAKENGYYICCIYVLTKDPKINTERISHRLQLGGNDLSDEVIKERYDRALQQIPQLIALSDVIHIFDNTEMPFRIYKKENGQSEEIYENEYWSRKEIQTLVNSADE